MTRTYASSSTCTKENILDILPNLANQISLRTIRYHHLTALVHCITTTHCHPLSNNERYRIMAAFAPSSAFTPWRAHALRVQQRRPAVRVAPRALVTGTQLAGKTYQLEEDEDSLSCTSAVFLAPNGVVDIGRTDGPLPDRVEAKWLYEDEEGGRLTIDIMRWFGLDKTPFSVRRVLRGHLDDGSKHNRTLPLFTGAMYREDVFEPHCEVGYFAMILAIDDLPEEDFNVVSG